MLRPNMFHAALMVIFLLLACHTVNARAQAYNYTVVGPCSTQTVDFGSVRMPSSTGCSSRSQCTVSVKVTAPVANCTFLQGAAAPVVVFFNGFLASSTQYSRYATRLATYGYAVMQYDLSPSLFNPVSDRVELSYMNIILDNVNNITAARSHKLNGLLDFAKIGVAGHSRGGKLAALQLANNPRVLAGYLIDPVDNTNFTPESTDSPSAAKSLRQAATAGRPKTAGVTGAGIIGSCNPQGSNYPSFYGALAAGSWLQVLPTAGHVAFSGGGGALLCGGRGSLTSSTAINLSATTLTAWMESQLRNKALPSGPFQAWLDALAATLMTFNIKA